MDIIQTSLFTLNMMWTYNFAIDLNELQSILKAEISVAQQYY